MAGVRIITYFPGILPAIDKIIRDEFEVLEWSDKGQILLEEEKFGYQSIHYLVRLKRNRSQLPEYERFRDSVTEIQLRTILQHAWAEIEHDIQYKGASVIPVEIRRRFMALAGMLEIADREFQAIQNADAELSRRLQRQEQDREIDALRRKVAGDMRFSVADDGSQNRFRRMLDGNDGEPTSRPSSGMH